MENTREYPEYTDEEIKSIAKKIAGSVADVKVIKVNQIIPYWRNPRDNNETAVRMVAGSISEFSYIDPIIVSKDNTIICGHTRYKSVKSLGFESVEVMVSDLSDKESKEYRLIANRSSEYSKWIAENVAFEFARLPKTSTLNSMFPELSLPEPIKEEDTKEKDSKPELDISNVEIELVCPNCFNGIVATWSQVEAMIARGKELQNGQ